MFTDNEIRPGEKRISCMLFDSKHDRLITGKYKCGSVSMEVYVEMFQWKIRTSQNEGKTKLT